MESGAFLQNRPPSPSLDALTMKYLNPLGSQESVGDSSSSDAASQTSSESPAGDWSLGLPSTWSDNKADDPWQWMDLDKLGAMPNGLASLSLAGQTIPAQNAFSQLAPEPMILNFGDAFLYQQQQAMIQQQPLFPPSASPADILGSQPPTTLPTSTALPQPSLPSFESLAQLQQLSALMQSSIPQQLTQQLQTAQPSQAPSSGAAGEADDIAARARALAGVSAAISQPKPGTLPSTLLTPDVMQAYLAATSAAQFAPATPSPISTASTSPAPSSPPSSEPAPDVVIGSSGRPKTSHTTIERRYRTNLNARITALRHAVPALRILDKDQFPDEIVDEKGYVDGVKAARKASKASVLGKAAEYIHVLKKREIRLRKEVHGLRALVSGLIGGPLLLKEWEKGWKERYGDEEREEAEAESDVGDEDSEDEDDKPRKKPKVVTPPKPPVIAPKEKKSPSQVTNPIVPETGKRKRGRPRKIQANGSEDSLAPLPIAPQVTTFQANPQQPQILAPAVDPTTLFAHHTTHEQPNATYLLGVFLFFSFFKPSPDGATSPSPVHHTHTGSVLSSLSSSKLSRTVQASTSSLIPLVGIPWSTALHHLHTVMSIVLILSLVVPFLPSPRSLFSRSGSKAGSKAVEDDESEDLMEERTRLSKALRTRGLIWEAILASLGSLKAKLGLVRSSSGELSETEVVEREAWRKLSIVELMLGPTLPFVNHFTKVLALWNRQPTSPTFVDLSTLAFLVRPFSASFANQLWAKAQALVKKSSVSHRAAHSLRLDFPQAVEMFEQAVGSGFAVLDEDEAVNSPIEMVTDVLLLETVKALLGKMFIKTTESHLPTSLSDMDHLTASVSTLQSAPENLYRDDAEMSELAEYVLVIGENSRGQVAEILKLWEKLWKEQADDEILAELESEEEDEEDEEYSQEVCPLVRETRDLIKALVLLRKVLFSSMVSDSSSTSTCSPTRSASMTPTSSSTCLALSSLPPPSPSPTLANFPHFPPSSTSTLKLRQALAASVFDEDEEIEEARDAVVDMLCNDRLTMRRSRFH